MKERPILFSVPMVRAILEGRKTQTRRVVKLKRDQYIDTRADTGGWWPMWDGGEAATHAVFGECPYGQPGDRIWVREMFSRHLHDTGCWYWADGNEADKDSERPRPSIHMPRALSRITLAVVAVRVEPLQSITETDAAAEGVRPGVSDPFTAGSRMSTHAESFSYLWDSINAKRAPWSSNPWVWVVEFKRIDA